MDLTFRWYGKEDPISLEYISQIPNMKGIVTAVYDVPVGEVWPEEKIKELVDECNKYGLDMTTIESVPVHEDIKMGVGKRDEYIENYKTNIRNLAKYGIKVITYNFMPVFDWTRSNLEFKNSDGSTSLIFDEEEVAKLDPKTLSLPGWDSSYDNEEMKKLIEAYEKMSHDDMWANLKYFLDEIIPVAVEEDVLMAIHPDDPPFDIFGLPRIITNFENLEKFINLYDVKNNGLALCTGSLGCVNTNDVVEMIKYFGGEKDRIHFAHVRNVKNYGKTSFNEVAHPSNYGDVDMYEVFKAYLDYGFSGPYRPDHGRMIWGETGKPGYGLYDRALGATYFEGLIEAIEKGRK